MKRSACRRRGTALIYISVAMTAFAGFVVLGVDAARLRLVKVQLQGTADAAARAACQNLPNGVTAAQNAAVAVAAQNLADGTSVTLTPATDIVFGTWNPGTKTFTVLTGSAQANANAVQVLPGRTSAGGNAVRGIFSGLLGTASSDVRPSSIACLTGASGNYSIIGLNSIKLSPNAFTDSYNSSLGAYSAASANKNGSIASNGDITIDNGTVNGDARCGVGKSTVIHGNGTVTGLDAPLGTVLSYPSVTLPANAMSLGDVTMSSGTLSVPGGTYVIDHLNLSGTATINWMGPTTLYIRYAYSVSGSAAINTYQNIPANRVLYFLPTCPTATWTGSNVCVGELYAPDTDFSIDGTVELMGRILAKSIDNKSKGGMHYDEALGPPGNTGTKPTINIVQ